jgi:hypothetical protein
MSIPGLAPEFRKCKNACVYRLDGEMAEWLKAAVC